MGKQLWDLPLSAVFLDWAVEGVVVGNGQRLPNTQVCTGGICLCSCPGKKDLGRQERLARILWVPPQLKLVFQHVLPQEKVKLGSVPGPGLDLLLS